MKTKICSNCEEQFSSLGHHWRYNPSHRPKLSNRQHKVIVGLLMGDGGLYRESTNPYFQINMTSPDYLSHVSSEVFPELTTDMKLIQTAEESVRDVRERGFRPNAEVDNYSNIYQLRSRCHPELEQYSEWYSSGEKVWPHGIELTPTILKHWYCGDGTLVKDSTHRYIKIALDNESKNRPKVEQMFEDVNFNIGHWNDTKSADIVFTKETSDRMFEYMGSPLPDFKYKWPKVYR